MRSESEIKSKIAELLDASGDERAKLVESLDKLEVAALSGLRIESHSVRGMLSGLFWALGYSFSDIRLHLVESLADVAGDHD